MEEVNVCRVRVCLFILLLKIRDAILIPCFFLASNAYRVISQ